MRVIGSVTFIVAVIVLHQAPTLAQSAGTLAWWAKVAKQEGKNTLNIGSFSEEDSATESLSLAAGKYTFVVGTPVQQAVNTDNRYIYTWYKLQVVRTLHTSSPCNNCEYSLVPPATLLPLQHNELALVTSGGTATVGGVSLHMFSQLGTALDLNQSYLFVVAVDRDQVVHLVSNTTLFRLSPNDTLSTDSRRLSALAKQILEIGSLSALQQALPK